MIMLPAGKYYIGDLCYVIHNTDTWHEITNLVFPRWGETVEGEFTLKSGVRIANFRTQWGDGDYEDQEGNSYPVDSGSIGCILVSDIDDSDTQNDTMMGTIHEFTEPFEVSTNDGVLNFGPIWIDTNPDYPDEYESDDIVFDENDY